MEITELNKKYKFGTIDIVVTKYFPEGNIRIDVEKVFGLYDSAYDFKLDSLHDLSELAEALNVLKEDLEADNA